MLNLQTSGTLAADLAFNAYQFTFYFTYWKLNLHNGKIKCQPTTQFKITCSVKMNNLHSTSVSEPLFQCADYNSNNNRSNLKQSKPSYAYVTNNRQGI